MGASRRLAPGSVVQAQVFSAQQRRKPGAQARRKEDLLRPSLDTVINSHVHRKTLRRLLLDAGPGLDQDQQQNWIDGG